MHHFAATAKCIAKSRRNVLEQMHADNAFSGDDIKALDHWQVMRGFSGQDDGAMGRIMIHVSRDNSAIIDAMNAVVAKTALETKNAEMIFFTLNAGRHVIPLEGYIGRVRITENQFQVCPDQTTLPMIANCICSTSAPLRNSGATSGLSEMRMMASELGRSIRLTRASPF